jgi:hypothetical protein
MVTALPSCYAETQLSPQMEIALSSSSRVLAEITRMSSSACATVSLVVTLVACSCCCVDTDRLE